MFMCICWINAGRLNISLYVDSQEVYRVWNNYTQNVQS